MFFSLFVSFLEVVRCLIGLFKLLFLFLFLLKLNFVDRYTDCDSADDDGGDERDGADWSIKHEIVKCVGIGNLQESNECNECRCVELEG